MSIADHSFGSSENLSSSLSRSPHRAGPEHFWARTAQGPARRPVRVIWPCLDEHPPECLPPRTERVPPTRRRLLRTACRRQGRKSQFHCDEQALTVAEVFSLTAGSVCARTPTSFAATPMNEHPRCSMPDPPANIGKRPILRKHSEQTSANQIPGTGHLSRHRGYCAASVTTSWHRRRQSRRLHYRTAATDEVPYRAARFESRPKAAAFVGTRQSSDLQGPKHFPKASGTLGCRVLIRVVIMLSHSEFGQPPQWR